MAAPVPPELYARDSLVVRPRDLADRWANPAKELSRLARSGTVRPLTHGYWLVPPADRLTLPGWRPEVEALALAVAVADYGPEAAALMGVSAARLLGAVPRAVTGAVVAVPRQRPPLRTPFGELTFVRRDTGRLDVEPVATALVTGAVTTVEQTMLDLADRPELGGLRTQEIADAVRALAVRADWASVMALARAQRLHAAYVRARWLAAPVLPAAAPPAWPHRRPVPALGLAPTGAADLEFGIADAPA